MTVVIAELVGENDAYLLADSLFTTLNSTNAHVDTPLGVFLNEGFHPETYYRSFSSMRDKSIKFGDNIALAAAGTYFFSTKILRHIYVNKHSITSLGQLLRLFVSQDQFFGTDVCICGFIIISGKPVLFSYDYHDQKFTHGNKRIVIGSGAECASKYADERGLVVDVEDRIQVISNYLYGQEAFTHDSAYKAIGGAYLGYVFESGQIRRPKGVTHFFQYARVSACGEEVTALPPFFLNQYYDKEFGIVRSMRMFLNDSERTGEVAELESKGPYIFAPAFYETLPDEQVKRRSTEDTFCADLYLTNFYITVKGDSYTHNFTIRVDGSRVDCPIKFWGTWQDHYFSISPTFLKAATDIALKRRNAIINNIFSKAGISHAPDPSKVRVSCK